MHVRRATVADIPKLSVTAMRAFAVDPVMRWLYPDDDTYLAPGGQRFWPAMASWLGHDEVWCTDDAVGVAVWIPPGRPESPTPPDPQAPSIAPDLHERFSIIGPLLAAHTPPEPHWYLQLLGTHPDWQRQGIGTALMEVMFERADSEGLACHLETETIENVAYYRRHGFEVDSEFDVPTGRFEHRFSSFGADPAQEVGPHMWSMTRPPH